MSRQSVVDAKVAAVAKALAKRGAPVKKLRKRPDVKGHPGIERGSEAAAVLYWRSVQGAMDRGEKTLPAYKPLGFLFEPSPPTRETHRIFSAWQRYAREKSRESFMRASPEVREQIYWGAVDHAAMYRGPAPDPYIFGYDDIPVRPAHLPEPAYVREVRAILDRAQHREDDALLHALGVLGLPLSPKPTAHDVRHAFRRLCLVRHPDRGGTAESFQALVKAKAVALAAI